MLSFTLTPFSPAALAAFVQIVLIDLSLAGDNAIVIGLAAAGLPQAQRRRAIAVGIIGATILRIGLAIITVQLLQIPGLVLLSGLLLLLVAAKMWKHLRHHHTKPAAQTTAPAKPQKTLREAIMQIIIADVAMSLDNVLAVAGAAHEYPSVLVAGLLLSVGLMGMAAAAVERLLHRLPWLAYAGWLMIIYISCHMIWDGSQSLLALLNL